MAAAISNGKAIILVGLRYLLSLPIAFKDYRIYRKLDRLSNESGSKDKLVLGFCCPASK